MSDVVQQIRDRIDGIWRPGTTNESNDDLMSNAADEIERLRAKLAAAEVTEVAHTATIAELSRELAKRDAVVEAARHLLDWLESEPILTGERALKDALRALDGEAEGGE